MSGDRGPTDTGQATGKHPGAWTWLVSMAATVGFICTYARWGWQGVASGAVMASTVSVCTAAAMWVGDGRGAALRGGLRALTAALLFVAGIGLVAVFEIAGVCVVLLLVGFAPGLRSLVRQRWPGLHPAAPAGRANGRGYVASGVTADSAGDQAAHARRELRALDDRTLCRHWRDSFALLNDASSMAERLSVVQLREWYLDELHRRSPRGLDAWFASGPRASSNPLPFLSDHGSPSDDGPQRA